MYTNKEIFWAALVYYLISIFSIYNFIMLYIEGELAYFITFIIIFAIDKIVTLIIALDMREFLPFWIYDIFQVGFIYIFFTSFYFDIEKSIVTKTLARVFPQIIIEFIFFFCLGIARNNNISENSQIATFINFFLFTLLLIILICILDQQGQSKIQTLRIIFDQLIKISGYYFSLCSLTYLQDPFGINLGYYQLVIFLISTIALFAKQIIKNDEYFRLIGLAVTTIFLNQEWGQDQKIIIKFSQSMNYISQLARVILIAVFCDLQELFQQQNSSSNTLKQICIISTFFLSGIYFLIYFKPVISHMLTTKSILIQQESSIKKALQILGKKHIITSKFEILFDYYDINKRSLLASVRQGDQMLEFWQKVSLQIKLKNQVNLDIKYYTWRSYFYIEYLQQIEYIHMDILLIYNNEINKFILFQRFEDGMLCNETSLKMIYYYEFNQSEQRKSNLFSILVTQILSFNIFLKDYSQYLSIMPAQILYDLHE